MRNPEARARRERGPRRACLRTEAKTRSTSVPCPRDASPADCHASTATMCGATPLPSAAFRRASTYSGSSRSMTAGADVMFTLPVQTKVTVSGMPCGNSERISKGSPGISSASSSPSMMSRSGPCGLGGSAPPGLAAGRAEMAPHDEALETPARSGPRARPRRCRDPATDACATRRNARPPAGCVAAARARSAAPSCRCRAVRAPALLSRRANRTIQLCGHAGRNEVLVVLAEQPREVDDLAFPLRFEIRRRIELVDRAVGHMNLELAGSHAHP